MKPDLHKWFDIRVNHKHRHEWGSWILMVNENINYNHRMVQGQRYTTQRTCTTCGQIDYQITERKLNLTS